MMKSLGLGYQKNWHVSKLFHVVLPWKCRVDWVQNI
jgi:hypothetical protein